MFCFNCAAMLVFGDAAQPAAVTDAQKAELFDEMPPLRQAETLARDLASQIRRIRGPYPPRTDGD